MDRINIILIIIYLLAFSVFFVKTTKKEIKDFTKEKESTQDQEYTEEQKVTEKKYPTQLLKYNKAELFKDMLENHYDKIFPNNGNRNAAGFRFFQYIYDNFAKDEKLFDLYNQFYCAVSGSIVSPDRQSNYDILKVKDMNGKCVVGKYYRCCTPCNCDLMKYTRIIKTKIAIPKNSNNMIEKHFLTIADPCVNEDKIPLEMDKSVVNCKNNLVSNGYRINDKGEITKDDGRLIIGLLYPIEDNEQNKNMLQASIDRCIKGNKRFLTEPDNLQYGMGDIFVKFALINDKSTYTNTVDDLCN